MTTGEVLSRERLAEIVGKLRIWTGPDAVDLNQEERLLIADQILRELRASPAVPAVTDELVTAFLNAYRPPHPGKTYEQRVKDALEIAVRQQGAPPPDQAPYGYCPQCGAVGKRRERRPNGDDMCANLHIYPSRTAAPTPPREDGKYGPGREAPYCPAPNDCGLGGCRCTPPRTEEAGERPYLPTYGSVPFSELAAAVGAARGDGQEYDTDQGYPGHRGVPFINYNSLNRIVTYFVQAALRSAPATVVEDGMRPLNAMAADLLRPYLKPGQKVIWRGAFRWFDDEGVISGAYDGQDLSVVADDNGWEVNWEHNLHHAAIVTPKLQQREG